VGRSAGRSGALQGGPRGDESAPARREVPVCGPSCEQAPHRAQVTPSGVKQSTGGPSGRPGRALRRPAARALAGGCMPPGTCVRAAPACAGHRSTCLRAPLPGCLSGQQPHGPLPAPAQPAQTDWPGGQSAGTRAGRECIQLPAASERACPGRAGASPTPCHECRREGRVEDAHRHSNCCGESQCASADAPHPTLFQARTASKIAQSAFTSRHTRVQGAQQTFASTREIPCVVPSAVPSRSPRCTVVHSDIFENSNGFQIDSVEEPGDVLRDADQLIRFCGLCRLHG
jgi:hypothetical protein